MSQDSDDRSSRRLLLALGAVAVVLVGALISVIALVGMTAMVVFSALEDAEQAYGDCGQGQSEVVYGDGDVRLPVVGKFTYTSAFGQRFHPIHRVMRLHGGIDLVSAGSGDIVAPTDATVVSVTMGDPGAGNFVVLEHGGGITSRYLHLSSVTVRTGQELQAGQKIGVEGTTGSSTGVHLHFEIRKDGTPTDPAAWLTTQGVSLPAVGGTGTASGAQSKSESKGSVEMDEEAATRQVTGSGFDLPKPGKERKDSLHTDAMPIPARFKTLYQQAARKYGLPWELLAGVGMAETHHGRLTSASSAGALGPMQFMPATWASDISVDGDGDGAKTITNPADSIHSAAHYLSMSGATTSPQGVKDALFEYNRAVWYGNDVLVYAHAYASGDGISVSAAGDDCGRVDAASGSNQTTDCPTVRKHAAAEKGLTPTTLNILRCGAGNAPWIKTIHGLGQRSGATDHDDGRAVDFMIPDYTDPSATDRGWKLAKWLQRNARQLGIRYLIFDQKIWNIERHGEGWRPMENRGSDTENHLDHIHVSAG